MQPVGVAEHYEGKVFSGNFEKEACIGVRPPSPVPDEMLPVPLLAPPTIGVAGATAVGFGRWSPHFFQQVRLENAALVQRDRILRKGMGAGNNSAGTVHLGIGERGWFKIVRLFRSMAKGRCQLAQCVSPFGIAPSYGDILQTSLVDHIPANPVSKWLAGLLFHPVRQSTVDDGIVEEVAAWLSENAHLQDLPQGEIF